MHRWFDAGFDLLAEGGPAGLTVAALCDRLWVSRGSFTHHFGRLPVYTEALLSCWESRFAVVLADNVAQRDPVRRLEHSTRHTLAIPHETEAALRAWGVGDRTVGESVAHMDRARRHVLRDAVAGVVPDPDRAEAVADMGVALLIGLQQYGRPLDRELFLAAGTEWLTRDVGVAVRVVDDRGTPHVRIAHPRISGASG